MRSRLRALTIMFVELVECDAFSTLNIIFENFEKLLQTRSLPRLSLSSWICINFLVAPVYGVYVFQLIIYSTTCVSYHESLHRGLLLPRKLLKQGFLVFKLTSSLRHCTMTWLTVLRNICATNDHDYVPFVVITTRLFLIHDFQQSL